MSVAYWGPKTRVRLPFLPDPTPLAIDWDGRSNVESLSFSFDGFKKTQWFVVIEEPMSHFPIPIPVPDVNPLSPPLGAKSSMPLVFRPMVGMAKYTPVQAAAIALAKAAETAQVIGAHGTLDVLRYGMVLPLATVVQVRGGSITFDGDYYVESVTHTIKNGSYKQGFELTRNARLPGSNPLSYRSSQVQELAGFVDATATQVGASAAGVDAAARPVPLPGTLGPLPGTSGPSSVLVGGPAAGGRGGVVD